MVAGDHNAVTMQADRTGQLSQRDTDWTECVEGNETGGKSGHQQKHTQLPSRQRPSHNQQNRRLDDVCRKQDNFDERKSGGFRKVDTRLRPRAGNDDGDGLVG